MPFLWPGLLSLGWLLCVLFIGVRGEFPLNDDFAYARSTLTWLETGRFERLSWTYTPILTNVAIGVLASKLLGFSFETLRLTGVLFGWLGMLGAYGLCRRYRVPADRSALAAATLAFNPVYLSLSFTFMTDVPFSALVIWSQVLMFDWLERRGVGRLLGAVVLGLLAVLSRQTGMALFVAFGLSTLLVLRRRDLLLVGASAVAVALAYLGSGLLAREAGHQGHYFGLIDAIAEEFQTAVVLPTIVLVWTYVGAFIVPVAALLLGRRLCRPGRPIWFYAVFGIATVVSGVAGILHYRMGLPPGLNVVMDVGIGPRILHGHELTAHAPASAWWAVIVAALLSAAVAAAYLLPVPQPGRGSISAWAGQALRVPASRWVAPVFIVVFLLPHLGRAPMFDRYLLTVLPGLLAMLLASMEDRPLTSSLRARLAGGAAALGLAGLVSFSVLATHDYLEHHRARWALLERLQAQGVAPGHMDGGFEFLAWHRFAPWPDDTAGEDLDYRFWLEDDEYVLTLHDALPGRTRILSRSYRRFIPPGRETLHVLKRVDGPPAR